MNFTIGPVLSRFVSYWLSIPQFPREICRKNHGIGRLNAHDCVLSHCFRFQSCGSFTRDLKYCLSMKFIGPDGLLIVSIPNTVWFQNLFIALCSQSTHRASLHQKMHFYKVLAFDFMFIAVSAYTPYGHVSFWKTIIPTSLLTIKPSTRMLPFDTVRLNWTMILMASYTQSHRPHAIIELFRHLSLTPSSSF